MGGGCSTCNSSLDEVVLTYLVSNTRFSRNMVKSLWTRFQNLDNGKKGFLIPSDMMEISKFRANPLAERLIITIFYVDKSTIEPRNHSIKLEDIKVTFPHFVESFDWFHGSDEHPHMTMNKVRFLFNIFDIQGTGFIKIMQIYELLEILSHFSSTVEDKLWSISEENIYGYEAK
ncbi:unnamed protein product [Lepeophtheirus salmonis]|uniref:(salmon louse) hypothetical protein n=1 Tax=Lepeophtheirus salmonis TaxID=72036 RepID=A0A7R8HAG1_LEPSM|nr:unnamed protein product [Lepeophtheirus salmonis]CAF2966391.1 unnamed protein product [Lepeophtheirus salmonis]